MILRKITHPQVNRLAFINMRQNFLNDSTVK